MRRPSPTPQNLVSQPHGRARQWLLAAAASSVLAACGGGDGPAVQSTASALAITSAASDSAAQPGAVASNGTTDDTTPTLSGSLAVALSSGQKLNVYDGSTMFSTAAVVNGTHWTFTPAAPLKNGLHRFTVEVAGFDGVATGSRSQPYVINVLVNETAPPAAPVLMVDDVANTVGGYNPATMEASFDKLNWSAVLPTLLGAVTLYVRVKASGITPAGLVATLDFTPNTPNAAPVVPTNMPTSFDVNGASGSIDLSSYIPAGVSLKFVSVADPGAANEVGSPQVTVNGAIVTILIPRGYGGHYNLTITFQLDNSAGSSPNFIITANNVIR